MDYKSAYFNIVNRAKTRVSNEYCEKHHIVPRSLGGLDTAENIVNLTYREHFLVHWLLTRICVGQSRWKMKFALGSMGKYLNSDRKRATSWQYSIAKKATSEAVIGTRKGMPSGFKHSEENKLRISKRLAGIPKSEEHKAKLRKRKPLGFGAKLSLAIRMKKLTENGPESSH